MMKFPLSNEHIRNAAPDAKAGAGPLEQGRCECHHDARMHYPNCHLCGCQQFKPLAARAVVGQGSDALRSLRELSEKATPGPWEYSHWRSNRETYTHHGIGNSVARGQVLMVKSTASGDKIDWQFIVACVNYVRSQLAAFAPVSEKE